MFKSLRGVSPLGLAVVVLAAIALIWGGCAGGQSPFLAAQFQTTLSNFLAGTQPGTPIPPDNDNNTNDNTISTVCDLPVDQRDINVSLTNESQQFVRFAITFVVSAGPGGFVCDEELPNYLAAGYSDAVPQGVTSLSIGCDTITLNSGNRILSLDYGLNQNPEVRLQPNPGGLPDTAPTITLTTRPPQSATAIPVPELIVFGDNDATFTCLPPNICTQRGFVYVSASNVPIGKPVEVSRLQGTVCNEGFGTAAEWRLDKTISNLTVQPFQYVSGGAIIATVLDRSGDSTNNSRNQAVWLVTDANDDTIHAPDP